MRKSWVAGFLAFSVVLIVGARHSSVDEFLVWAGICASDSRTPARSASLVLAAVQNASTHPPQRRRSLVRHRRRLSNSARGQRQRRRDRAPGTRNRCRSRHREPKSLLRRQLSPCSAGHSDQSGQPAHCQADNTLRNTGPDNTQNVPSRLRRWTAGLQRMLATRQASSLARCGRVVLSIQSNVPHLATAPSICTRMVRCVPRRVPTRCFAARYTRKLGRARCAAAPVSRRAQRAHLQLRYRIG